MIENRVGPPLSGIPEFTLRESARTPKGAPSDSFEQALDKTTQARPESSGADKAVKLPESVKKPESGKEPEIVARQEEIVGPRQVKTVEFPKGAREKAIQKFMDSFESEFGISPTELVGAMADLEPQKLNQTPEATATDLIQSLGLDKDETERAMEMYGALLQELQTIDRSTPLPQQQLQQKVDDSVSLIGSFKQRQEGVTQRRLAMNNSVDQLNERFWMTRQMPVSRPLVQESFPRAETFEKMDVAVPQDEDIQLIESAPMSEIEGSGLEVNQLIEGADLAESPQVEPEVKTAKGIFEKEAPVLKNKLSPLNVSDFTAARLVGGNELAVPTKNAVMDHLNSMKTNSQKLTNENSEVIAPVALQSILNGQSQSDSQYDSDTQSDSQSSQQEKTLDMKVVQQGPLRLEDVAKALKDMGPLPGIAGVPQPEGSSELSSQNIRHIMNQAQYLIKNGGGEMKVEMSPEGMGQVQLKVMVQDGKVNVQMAAESPETKKALESSLPELRSSLAAHKLSVDHVKVDIVSGPSSDTGTRNETNSGANQGRDGTRQFWNQFQEQFGNRSRQDAFWEVPNLKGYQRDSIRDPIRDRHADAQTQQTSRKGKTGSGLNLVA